MGFPRARPNTHHFKVVVFFGPCANLIVSIDRIQGRSIKNEGDWLLQYATIGFVDNASDMLVVGRNDATCVQRVEP